MAKAALGFAPHSGWAVAVGVRSVADRFEVLLRERVERVDAHEPESRQPYHAVEGSAVAAAAARLARYAATAERLAAEAIRRCVERLAAQGHEAVGVGILDSAGRMVSSLATILGSHALIHTADGEHFRAALASGASRAGLGVLRVPVRQLERTVVAFSGRSGESLHALHKLVARPVGPPWGCDQKSAALLAWLVLERSQSRDDEGRA
jgi:hypothetical protein